MNINGIIISERKLKKLSSIISEDILRDQYYKIPKKFLKDNQQPSLSGNTLEGSTTGESLNPNLGHDSNSHLGKVIFQDMPDFCLSNRMMIQSELMGNYER